MKKKKKKTKLIGGEKELIGLARIDRLGIGSGLAPQRSVRGNGDWSLSHWETD